MSAGVLVYVAVVSIYLLSYLMLGQLPPRCTSNRVKECECECECV